MKKEYGFIFNIKRCVQCHACELACKGLNNIEACVSWRRVMTYWEGEFPEVKSMTMNVSCIHCVDPECVKVCPVEAIVKKEENGIVLMDRDKCIACGSCGEVCPVQAPQYGKDGKMQKCDFCVNRVATGKAPVCVATCPSGALGFDYMSIDNKARNESEIISEFQKLNSF